MATAKYIAGHMYQDPIHNSNNYPHVGIRREDSDEMPIFRLARRYSKAEEAMHEDDRPLEKHEERRFSSTEAPTVVTAPYIWSHSVEDAPDQLHLLSKLRKEDEEMKSYTTSDSPPPPTDTLQRQNSENRGRKMSTEEGQTTPVRKMSIGEGNITPSRKLSLGDAGGRKLSFGEGGLGDHSAKLWDWPLGEKGKVEVHSTDNKFEAWFDFRPFQPNEIWAKVMGDDIVMHCKSENAYPGKPSEFIRCYTLPMNCDARSARFRIKFGHTLVVSVDKVLPIKLAIATFGTEETKQNKETVQ